MQNLVTGLRRVAIKRIDRRPSATPISFADEARAIGILEQQRHTEAFRRPGRVGRQSLRQLLEAVSDGVGGAVVHMSGDVSEAGDRRIALGHALQRERAIVVVLDLVEARFEIEVLILQGVGQLVREQHLADDVALNHELRRAVPEAEIAAALDQHHLFAVRIVEARDLALEQLERRGLEINPGGIETGERARNSVGRELVVGVVAHQVGFHHRFRFIGRLDDERNGPLESKLADVLDAGLDG